MEENDGDDIDRYAYEADDISFEFELLNSDDMLITTLVCSADKPLDPCEYAQALRAFADRIDSIVTMAEVSGNTVN